MQTRTLSRWRLEVGSPWHVDDIPACLPDISYTALCGVTVRRPDEHGLWAFEVGDERPVGFCKTCWKALMAGGWERASWTEDEVKGW
ncbi:MAG: hypothetical protein BWY85_01140 [Firmicutes bacterium ADurb.Bin506]|nr:MAG: hypothetical protein BWY85_01140 [Firmicutes bacterium ADurb.Bin506]